MNPHVVMVKNPYFCSSSSKRQSLRQRNHGLPRGRRHLKGPRSAWLSVVGSAAQFCEGPPAWSGERNPLGIENEKMGKRVKTHGKPL